MAAPTIERAHIPSEPQPTGGVTIEPRRRRVSPSTIALRVGIGLVLALGAAAVAQDLSHHGTATTRIDVPPAGTVVFNPGK